jgi:glycosyltransferase involved in cell wall biosynthesis
MIVTAVGGLPELIKDNQWTVPPRDPAALARAIKRCLKDPALLAAMAADSKEAAAVLGWLPIAKKTCGVYDKLIRIQHNPSD